MDLTIITINYNNAPGLQKTIESVVNQTSGNFEYIVIDGGSIDNSVDIIKGYSVSKTTSNNNASMAYSPCSWRSSGKRIEGAFLSEPDKGIYHAMNKGIRIAKGKYCQFINSGDRLAANDVIEKMLALQLDWSIFYGNMLKQLPNGKTIQDTCEAGKLTMLSFYRGSLNHSPAFIKRTLFEKYGLYDESLKIVSDWKWYLNVIVINNESLRYINLDVTCFDMNGISNTNKELEKQERRMVLEELLPARILADYDSNWRSIDQAIRINRYKITKVLFWFLDRVLFKWEKSMKNGPNDS